MGVWTRTSNSFGQGMELDIFLEAFCGVSQLHFSDGLQHTLSQGEAYTTMMYGRGLDRHHTWVQ